MPPSQFATFYGPVANTTAVVNDSILTAVGYVGFTVLLLQFTLSVASYPSQSPYYLLWSTGSGGAFVQRIEEYYAWGSRMSAWRIMMAILTGPVAGGVLLAEFAGSFGELTTPVVANISISDLRDQPFFYVMGFGMFFIMASAVALLVYMRQKGPRTLWGLAFVMVFCKVGILGSSVAAFYAFQVTAIDQAFKDVTLIAAMGLGATEILRFIRGTLDAFGMSPRGATLAGADVKYRETTMSDWVDFWMFSDGHRALVYGYAPTYTVGLHIVYATIFNFWAVGYGIYSADTIQSTFYVLLVGILPYFMAKHAGMMSLFYTYFILCTYWFYWFAYVLAWTGSAQWAVMLLQPAVSVASTQYIVTKRLLSWTALALSAFAFCVEVADFARWVSRDWGASASAMLACLKPKRE